MAGIEKMKESRLINFIQFSDCANFYKTSKQTKSRKVVCIHTIHMTTWLVCVLFGTPFVKFQSHIFCAEEGECILLHVAWKHPLSPCHQKVLTSLPVALWTGEIKFKANPIPPIAKWKTEEIHTDPILDHGSSRVQTDLGMSWTAKPWGSGPQPYWCWSNTRSVAEDSGSLQSENLGMQRLQGFVRRYDFYFYWMKHKSRKFIIVNTMIHVKGTCSWMPGMRLMILESRGKLIPLLDNAYQGYASGELAKDGYSQQLQLVGTVEASHRFHSPSTGFNGHQSGLSHCFQGIHPFISLPFICATLWGLHRVGWSSSSLLGTYWAQFSWNVLCHWGGLTFTTSCSAFTHFLPHVFPHYMKA